MRKTITRTTFDSMLDTDRCTAIANALLTVTLKLGFRQVNPAAGVATGSYNVPGRSATDARKIIQWTPAAWATWKQGFITSARSYWDQKFWLLNNTGKFAFKPGDTVYIPDVSCALALDGTDYVAGGGYHHTIDVLHLDPSETFFRSHSTLYDNLDTNSVQKQTDSAGKPIMQQAHVHEIGHLLGLAHVDVGKAHCPTTGDTNASQCYGVNDTDMNSVMGGGMRLDVVHAKAWLLAFDEHAKAEPVSPLYAPPAAAVKAAVAYLTNSYPRTTSEFEAGVRMTTPFRISPVRIPNPLGSGAAARPALRR